MQIDLSRIRYSDKMASCSNCEYATVGYIRMGQGLWHDCRKQPDWQAGGFKSFINTHVCQWWEKRAKTAEDDTLSVLNKILGKGRSKVDDALAKILG